jgi:hypothetical protein
MEAQRTHTFLLPAICAVRGAGPPGIHRQKLDSTI